MSTERLISGILHPKKAKQNRFVVTYTNTTSAEKLPANRKVNSLTRCLLSEECVCVCERGIALYWRGSGRTAATQRCCSSSGDPGRRRGCRWWREGWGASSEAWCDLHAGLEALGWWAPAGSAKPRRLGLSHSLQAKVVHQDDPEENTLPPRTDITQFAAGCEALNMPFHTPEREKNSRYDSRCYHGCVSLVFLFILDLYYFIYIRWTAYNHVMYYCIHAVYTILYQWIDSLLHTAHHFCVIYTKYYSTVYITPKNYYLFITKQF